jgi:hypothetical protein
MFKRIAPLLVCLLAIAATAADAQPGGGRGRGGPPGAASRPAPPPAPKRPPSAASLLPIVGVVKAIDLPGGRLTIAYEVVESLNWPAGTQPFPVSKTAMLSDVTVGEKIRFAIVSGEISGLAPFDPPAAP